MAAGKRLATMVFVSVALTACTGDGHRTKSVSIVGTSQSSVGTPITTGTELATRSTGVASVDAVVNALLVRDLDQLVNDVRFENMACVAEPSESNFGPQCPPGTPEGTPLPTFPFEFCSGGLVTTKDDVRQGFTAAFSSSAPSVYAVVKAGTVVANTENVRNPGYSIVLDPGTAPSSTANATGWILNLDGRIVEMDFGCGPKTAAQVVQQQYAGQEFLLPPLLPAAKRELFPELGVAIEYPTDWATGATQMPYATCLPCTVVGPRQPDYPYGIQLWKSMHQLGCPLTCYLNIRALPQEATHTTDANRHLAFRQEFERQRPLGLVNGDGDSTSYREILTVVPLVPTEGLMPEAQVPAVFIDAFYRYGDAAAETQTREALANLIATLEIANRP